MMALRWSVVCLGLRRRRRSLWVERSAIRGGRHCAGGLKCLQSGVKGIDSHDYGLSRALTAVIERLCKIERLLLLFRYWRRLVVQAVLKSR